MTTTPRWMTAALRASKGPLPALPFLTALSIFIMLFSLCSSMRPHKPTSALAGFMRFLHLVSQHEWQAYPLLCDPTQALKDDEIKAALKAYRALLSTSSAPAVSLITPHDMEGSTWTKTGPSAVMTTRMRRLAATSLRCMTCALTGVGQWRQMESECVSDGICCMPILQAAF